MTTNTVVELSPKEELVVREITTGKTYEEIATALNLGYETVKTYAARVRKKLNVTSKVQIVLWAIANGYTAENG